MAHQAHVAQWKKDSVDEMTQLAKAHPVIAVSNIEGLPAAQFQEIRGKIHDKAVVKVAKVSLLKRAFENAGITGLDGLNSHMEGPTAVIFSDVDPFRLSKALKQNTSKTAIKSGQEAPMDIIVPAGDTGLPPGPALGELKVAGLNAKIDGGSIKIISDSTVVKAGDIVTPEKAAALAKLGIKPMEVGLSLNAAYDKGMIYLSDVLKIDEETTISSMQAAYRNAFNLAFNAGYYMKENIETFIQKASREAKAVAEIAKDRVKP